MKSFIISALEENQRADKYVMKILGKASKSFIYKMIRKKNIKLNGQKFEGHELLKQGDEFTIYFSDETFDSFTGDSEITSQVPVKMTFSILFEDENLLVCNKPVGLLSQPDGEGDNLVDQLVYYVAQKQEVQTLGFKTGICNRLDRNTSGIVIAGKNMRTLQALNSAISERTVDKSYLTIVKGVIYGENTLESYLIKDENTNKVSISKEPTGDYIKTIYKPLQNNGHYTLLEVKIITGKSHQIRAHLGSIGHPIVGDTKYGDRQINEAFHRKYGLKNQLLHAHRFTILEINEGFSYLKNKTFVAPLPEQFDRMKKEMFKEA